ncbi:MAG: condensation domain-containing protein, partial [Acidobacteria bacterium]|nr:condensation domain-containing protein [Acidobacteriota bacterium]
MWQEKISSKDISIASHQNIKERNYWLNQLAGELTKSNFPYDHHTGHAGPGEKAYKKFEFHLDDLLFSQLMKISKGIDYTLHMILTAAAAALLGRYSGHNDIIVGMPIYRQDSSENFVNKVVALRIHLDESMTFKDLLLHVRQTVIDADQYQNYAIEALIYQLHIPDAGEDFPLFDCAILLENIHDKTYLQNISLNTIFTFSRGSSNISGVLEYNSFRYREEKPRQITGHFKNLLASYLLDMNARVTSVEFLNANEKQQILYEFNDTGIDFPIEKTIVDLFADQVSRNPDRIALMGAADAETAADHFLSYREFNQRANSLAHMLRQKGARPNILVGLMADRTLDTMISIIGILKAGSAYLPIDPESPISRIVPILEDAGPKILLTKNTLIKNFSFTSLQGLRRSQHRLLYTAARAQITGLDHHPFPDRSLVDYDKYNRYIGQSMATKTIVIQAGRGCPYHCAYCHKIWPKTYAGRSAEHIFSEVKLNYELGMRQFAFVDDIFNLNRENSMKFFQMIIDSGLNKDIQFYFPNGLRGDILTHDYIDLMVAAGTVSCALALETASPRLQKLLRSTPLTNRSPLENTQRQPHGHARLPCP